MRFIFFAILITLIYSWEDLVNAIARWFSKAKNRGADFLKPEGVDDFVTAAVLFFALPLTLIYLFADDDNITFTLALIALELLAISVLSVGIRKFNDRMSELGRYNGLEAVGVVGFALVGLASPVFRLFARSAYTGHELVAKFALYMSLPAIAGWLVALYSPRDIITGDILPNMSGLITVAVGGLFVIITVNFLEQHFRMRRMHILAYFRVLLGIGLVFIISQGLV